jgi:hypothetical protein
MGEICSEFEASLNTISVLHDTSSLKLYRDTKKMFTRNSDSVSPLLVRSAAKNRRFEKIITFLLSDRLQSLHSDR